MTTSFPGNDDAIRAIKLFVAAFSEACMEGEAMSKDHKADAANAEEAMQKGRCRRKRPGPRGRRARAGSRSGPSNRDFHACIFGQRNLVRAALPSV